MPHWPNYLHLSPTQHATPLLSMHQVNIALTQWVANATANNPQSELPYWMKKSRFNTSISTLQPLSIVQPYALRTETYITACHGGFRKGKLLALVIIVRGTDITREMCSGAHIPRGNIYHCNTGESLKRANRLSSDFLLSFFLFFCQCNCQPGKHDNGWSYYNDSNAKKSPGIALTTYRSQRTRTGRRFLELHVLICLPLYAIFLNKTVTSSAGSN